MNARDILPVAHNHSDSVHRSGGGGKQGGEGGYYCPRQFGGREGAPVLESEWGGEGGRVPLSWVVGKGGYPCPGLWYPSPPLPHPLLIDTHLRKNSTFQSFFRTVINLKTKT